MQSHLIIKIFFMVLWSLNCFALPTTNIALLTDSPDQSDSIYFQKAIQELQELTQGERKLDFISKPQFAANGTLESARWAINEALKDKQVDLIITTGLLTSHATRSVENFNKPLLAPLVLNGRLQGFSKSLKSGSGQHNFAYIDRGIDLKDELTIFHRVVTFKHLAILVDQELETTPEFSALRDDIANSVRRLDAEVHFIALPAKPVDIGGQFTNLKIDAVMLPISQHLKLDELQDLASLFKERRLPSFSMYGKQSLKNGFLMSYSMDVAATQVARRIALYIQDILRGVEAGELNTELKVEKQLAFNAETAKELDISPDWQLLSESDLVNNVQAENKDKLTLQAAIELAANNNLEAVKQGQIVDAFAQNVDIADSYWFPQLQIGVQGRILDQSTANLGFGTLPQYKITPMLRIQQLLYDENLWANLAIQRYLLEAKDAERNGVLLDIRLKAAMAYLGVLRQITLERVQAGNLELTRANLRRAKARVATGNSSRNEIFRWESAVYRNQQDLLNATAQVKVAMIALNQTLNLPLNNALTLQDDIAQIMNVDLHLVAEYLNSPKQLQFFEALMVELGLQKSPESQALASSISAQERDVEAKKRVMFLPSLNIQVGLDETVHRSGAGSSYFPGYQGNDFASQVNLQATLPIFTGGKQLSELDQSGHQLNRLQTEHRLILQLVEQRIRSAVNVLKASYPNVDLAKKAEEDALNNHKIVFQAYSNGMVPIIDLLDAQNTLLQSRQNTANNIYKFLMDLMELQRAIGDFNQLGTEEGRKEVVTILTRSLMLPESTSGENLGITD